MLPSVSNFRALVGEGVEGEVEGHQVKVGSLVFIDGAEVGGFEFSDEAKPDAKPVSYTHLDVYKRQA